MFANIALQPVSDNAVLTIPKSSVIRSGGMTRVVLSEGDGKYRSTRIEVGREADDKIEVLQGLTQDDRIVTSAHFMLDSESSQTADLSRISSPTEATAQTAWTKGEITDVMKDHRMLTINHQPVPEWDWPGMVMNFTLADGVDMGSLQKGQAIEFEIQKPHRVNTKSLITKPMTPFSQLTLGNGRHQHANGGFWHDHAQSPSGFRMELGCR